MRPGIRSKTGRTNSYIGCIRKKPLSLRAQQGRSERWRRHYHHQRPHEALAMRVPDEVHRQSRRRLPVSRAHWRYARERESRRVKGKGMISFNGRGRFIGEAFEGERGGLKRSRAGVREVYFGPLLIGEP